MALIVGNTVSLIGTVRAATTGMTKANNPYVRADIDCEGEGLVRAVWWTAADAPKVGQRVSFSGPVREFNGRIEVQVYSSHVERAMPEDPLARVLGYYIDCIEAEAFENLVQPAGSPAFVSLPSGTAPAFSTSSVVVQHDEASRRWSVQRRAAIGETLLAGYPVVVGRRVDATGDGLSVSPIFTTEVALSEKDGRFVVDRLSDALEVNPAALELLGLTHEERDECLSQLSDSPDFESAPNLVDRLRAGMAIVLAAANTSISSVLEPFELQPLDRATPGVQNSGIVMATAGGTVFTRKLLEELEEVLRHPAALRSGPLGVLFGAVPAPQMPTPLTHPIIVPSTLRQDQAVHAAMTTPFTVVTGPPGTGKSQVLVNVVAAALAAGESVLFASKNNKAVDVVLDRIKEVTPRTNVMRAGKSSLRAELAAAIGEALSRKESGDSTAASSAQASVTRAVDGVFARIAERQRLESEAEQLGRILAERTALLPTGANLDFDRAVLAEHLTRASEALRSFSDPLPLLRRGKRWKIHTARLDAARAAASNLNGFLTQHSLGRFDAEPTLAPLTKPTRTAGPRNALQSVEGLIGVANEASEARANRAAVLARIDADFQLWSIEDALADHTEARLAAGRALIDGLWGNRVASNKVAAAEAMLMMGDLQTASKGGSGARSARGRIRRVLPALPVWSVTSLSAGTNFPMESDLFDLVVIDEASQCDVASAIPLLYRAKRALIIGDQRQLIHITQMGQARSRSIAKRWGVDDESHDAFNYISRSLFGLAASRLGEPLMLDLHFRSRSAIIEFSNRRFYGGRLEVCTLPPHERSEPTIQWTDVNGQAQRGRSNRSWRNTAEVEAVVATVKRLVEELHIPATDVGVVTPFRAQVEEIRLLADEALGRSMDGMLIETAHRFQGDERPIIILSPVVAPGMPMASARFAADPNLLNVALTRAKDRLIVVGDRATCLQSNTVLAEFAQYVTRLESSVFDSPLELELFDELLRRGIHAEPGRLVAGYRLDLAVESNGRRLDIECDGAPFHTIRAADAQRDAAIQMQGWTVLRFSGRQLSRDTRGCADRVVRALSD